MGTGQQEKLIRSSMETAGGLDTETVLEDQNTYYVGDID